MKFILMLKNFLRKRERLLTGWEDYICGEEYNRDVIVKDLEILNEQYANVKAKYPWDLLLKQR